MRKIEKDMLNAIATGRDFCRANTAVKHNDNGAAVYLYGNLICLLDQVGNRIFNLCGYNTVTTRSRLNALGASIRCKNFEAVNADGTALIPAPGNYGAAGYFVAKN